ncbi:Hypothetical protein SCF082_LOCUS21027 [Durusdinium trenchii]|uniref:Uncharacterized protein n=1 Tax=Durusdinium trenchii TaxID=1381693 RepID=A0ABP0L6V8_9DINO
MDEVVKTAVETLSGNSNFVAVDKIKGDAKVRSYFRRVLFKQPWENPVWVTYFQSRPAEWEFDERQMGVKVKSELATQIEDAARQKRKTAAFPEGLYTAVLRSGTPVETSTVIANAKDSEIAALPIDAIEALLGSLGNKPEDPAGLPRHMDASVKVMAAVPGSLEKKGAALSDIMKFFDLVLNFHGDSTDPRLTTQRILTLKELCEAAGLQIRSKGVGNTGTKALGLLCSTAPFHIMALAMAGLGEKGEGDDAKACANFIERVSPAILEALPSEHLIKLAEACAKSKAVAETILATVSKACSGALPSWSMDDVSKLLFALAKVKVGDTPEMAELYSRAAEVASANLSSLSETQLVKVVLTLSRVPACKEFVATAAAEVVNKMSTIAAPQLLLLTQGIASLGSDNASLMKLVEFWATDEVKLKQLSADQLAKLSQVLAPVVPTHEGLWKVAGARLLEQKASLADAGKASVLAAFSGEAPTFEDKEKLLAAVKPREREREKDRDKDRDERRSRGRDDRRDRRDDRRRSRSRDRRRDSRDRRRR